MIAIIDYDMGNLASVKNAFLKIGAEDVKISSDPDEVEKANGLVLPGVGAFADAMKKLDESGLALSIKKSVKTGTPFLGICLGYQLIFDSSEEGGKVQGLGLIRGKVKRFHLNAPVPHMGWNEAEFIKPEGIFEGFGRPTYFYFDHAYYPEPEDESVIAARTEYAGFSFVSAIKSGSIYGTQFHPEKSHDRGLDLIQNYYHTVKDHEREIE